MSSSFLVERVERRFSSREGKRADESEVVLLVLSHEGILMWSSGLGTLVSVCNWGGMWTLYPFVGGFSIEVVREERAQEKDTHHFLYSNFDPVRRDIVEALRTRKVAFAEGENLEVFNEHVHSVYRFNVRAAVGIVQGGERRKLMCKLHLSTAYAELWIARECIQSWELSSCELKVNESALSFGRLRFALHGVEIEFRGRRSRLLEALLRLRVSAARLLPIRQPLESGVHESHPHLQHQKDDQEEVVGVHIDNTSEEDTKLADIDRSTASLSSSPFKIYISGNVHLDIMPTECFEAEVFVFALAKSLSIDPAAVEVIEVLHQNIHDSVSTVGRPTMAWVASLAKAVHLIPNHAIEQRALVSICLLSSQIRHPHLASSNLTQTSSLFSSDQVSSAGSGPSSKTCSSCDFQLTDES